jgi:hydroxyacylglutathione hydrolase
MQQPSLEEIFGSYMAWKIDHTTWCINFMNGTQNLYLLEGEEKALLLDTGYGTNTLRAFVEGLTGKEIIVANTHFHPDHSAGNGEFEKVYLSKGEEIDAPSVGPGPFDLSKLPYPDYEKVYIGEGDKIELGGRTIEVLEALPAHCNNSLFFLDRGHRMFFTGDELEAAQVLLFDNSSNPNAPYNVKERLDNFYKNSKRIQDLSDEFDYLLQNHNGVVIAKSYVQEFMELVEHIYTGDALIEDKLNHRFIEMDPKAPELCRVCYKNASIFIKKALLMEVYGKEI